MFVWVWFAPLFPLCVLFSVLCDVCHFISVLVNVLRVVCVVVVSVSSLRLQKWLWWVTQACKCAIIQYQLDGDTVNHSLSLPGGLHGWQRWVFPKTIISSAVQEKIPQDKPMWRATDYNWYGWSLSSQQAPSATGKPIGMFTHIYNFKSALLITLWIYIYAY